MATQIYHTDAVRAEEKKKKNTEVSVNVRAPAPLHARPFTPLVPRPPERKHPRPFSPCYLPHRPTLRGRCLAWSAALALWGSTSRQGPPFVPGLCVRCMRWCPPHVPGLCVRCMRWCTRTARRFLVLGQATRSLLTVYQSIHLYTHMLAVSSSLAGPLVPVSQLNLGNSADLPQGFRCVVQNKTVKLS